MTDKKTVRDELASLTEAVRELRDDEVTAELRRLRAEVEALRAAKAAHHCSGCSCVHVHWHTFPNTWTYPVAPGCAGGAAPLIYTTNVTSVSEPQVTSVAAGGYGTYQLAGLSN